VGGREEGGGVEDNADLLLNVFVLAAPVSVIAYLEREGGREGGREERREEGTK